MLLPLRYAMPAALLDDTMPRHYLMLLPPRLLLLLRYARFSPAPLMPPLPRYYAACLPLIPLFSTLFMILRRFSPCYAASHFLRYAYAKIARFATLLMPAPSYERFDYATSVHYAAAAAAAAATCHATADAYAKIALRFDAAAVRMPRHIYCHYADKDAATTRYAAAIY